MHSTPIKSLFQVSFPLGKPGGARGGPGGAARPKNPARGVGGWFHLRKRGEGGSAQEGQVRNKRWGEGEGGAWGEGGGGSRCRLRWNNLFTLAQPLSGRKCKGEGGTFPANFRRDFTGRVHTSVSIWFFRLILILVHKKMT